MTLFKCKMCGGTLELEQGTLITTCQHCGSTMTLPRLNDEKIANMYDRANYFRRNNDFDKAMLTYESILNENNADAEAHWSIVLCRYGIEYVDDPKSHTKIPTCNRTQYTSILNDMDYQAALEFSDEQSRHLYVQEALLIDSIQKGILEISKKEKPFDVFVSYKETDHAGRRTKDSVLAQEIYFNLVQEGYKVFFSRITLENILGLAYEPYIFAALQSSRVMVVVGTRAEYFNSPWVKNEWGRYINLIKSGSKKYLVPAYKDMDPYDLPDDFSNLQALDMSKLGFIQDLIRGISKILNPTETTIQGNTKSEIQEPNVASLMKRAFISIEDEDFEKANEIIERVLDIQPESGNAYLAKLLINLKLKNIEELSIYEGDFESNKLYLRVKKYADTELNVILSNITESRNRNKDMKSLSELAVTYKDAVRFYNEGFYIRARTLFEQIIDYQDTRNYIEECNEKIEFEENELVKNNYNKLTSLNSVFNSSIITGLALLYNLQDYQLQFMPKFKLDLGQWLCSCGSTNNINNTECSCGITKKFAESFLTQSTLIAIVDKYIVDYRKDK